MADYRYAVPYIDQKSWLVMQADISEHGLETDRFLAQPTERRVCGLNVAACWPLPEVFETQYTSLADELSRLGDSPYIYPFSQTHITIATAVNFKSYVEPSDHDVQEILATSKAVGQFVAEASRNLQPFVIDIGPAVAVRKCAFLPILNPTGEIVQLRERTLRFCSDYGGILSGSHAPQNIHSTIMRFPQPIENPIRFLDAFNAIASNFYFGNTVIDRVLVTIETTPYMRRGEIAQSITL